MSCLEGIFMYSIQKAFDNAKCDEAPDIDIGQFITVACIPLLDTLALS